MARKLRMPRRSYWERSEAMERIEYRDVIDKSKWRRGPWDSEPDKVQWPDAATGLPCLIVRGPCGNLCGYVGVPPGHPLYERDCDDCPVMAHGGLTFSDRCQSGRPEDRGVCHRPAPGESDDVWWLGFDCAHWGDLVPSYPNVGMPDELYRDIGYVTDQCRSLAAQLAYVARCPTP